MAAGELTLGDFVAFVMYLAMVAWPLIAGEQLIDLPVASRISLIPYADFFGLDLGGVKWPLTKRDVPLGSSLTLSNVATGTVSIRLRQGYGLIIAYPLDIA